MQELSEGNWSERVRTYSDGWRFTNSFSHRPEKIPIKSIQLAFVTVNFFSSYFTEKKVFLDLSFSLYWSRLSSSLLWDKYFTVQVHFNRKRTFHKIIVVAYGYELKLNKRDHVIYYFSVKDMCILNLLVFIF